MKRLGRVLAGVVGLALAGIGGLIFLMTAMSLRRASASFGMDLFVAAVFLASTAAGLLLIRVAWPGALARVSGQVVAAVFEGSLLYNPLLHGFLIYVVAALLFAVTGRSAILVALAAGCVYAVGSPAVITLRPHWKVNAALAIFTWIILLGALPSTVEAVTHRRVGEDALVMLWPFMLFPLALLASLVFRLAWMRGRVS